MGWQDRIFSAARKSVDDAVESAGRSVQQPALPGGWSPSSGPPPELSLKDAVGRWYANTGGVDEAIESSQRALKDAHPEGWDNLYGTWTREDAERTIPLREDQSLPEHHHAEWRAAEGPVGEVALNPARRPYAPADWEHELTHGTLLPGRSSRGILGLVLHTDAHTPITSANPDALAETIRRIRDAHKELLVGRGTPEHQAESSVAGWYDTPSARSHYEYLSRPGEIDPRLAEIRRRFEFSTGIPVKGKAEAKAAMDWWTGDGRRIWYGGVDPANVPTMEQMAFNLYGRMPDEVRKAMVQRMPQVLAVPFAVGVGAAASQDRDGGVLGGLRSRP